MQQLFKKKIYVFDVDNTLVDWNNLKTLFHDISYSFEITKIQKSLNQRRGLRNNPPLQLPLCSPLPIHPELLQFLKHLRDNKEIIVIFSDLPHPELHDVFEKFQIQLIIDGQDIASTKPLPDGLWQIASQYSVPASEIIFIGDQDKTDFHSAIRAGVQYFSVDHLKQIGWREFYHRLT